MVKIETYYLTTAIPYVNAAPHIGHALEFVQTDVIARYQRLQGKDTALVTGSDENSLKNVHAAEKQGITTAQLCERNAEIFKNMAEKIGLSFTSFRRTSSREKHWPGVQRLWELCDKSGDIYKKKYRGLYCVGCESFYEESELPEGVCPEHKTKPEMVEEENYFFKLSKYEKKLEGLIESNELQVLPKTRKNEVLSFIRGGLKDFSVSRSVERAKGWGVPVPNDPSQILYVWFDALGTYLTGIGYGTDDETFSKYWPADVHVIGKGILRFHAIYWPAMLLSAGLELPKRIMVHGYITVEGQKMGKSLGNMIDPFHLMEKYGADPLRYCLLSEVPTFDDGDFSEKALIGKTNRELIANLGNFLYRTLKLIEKFHDSKIPEPGELDERDEELLASITQYKGDIAEYIEKIELKRAQDAVLEFSSLFNKYLSDREPWKNEEKRSQTLYVCSRGTTALAIFMEPFLPFSAEKLRSLLNMKGIGWSAADAETLQPGGSIKAEPLFRKIE